MRKWTVLYGGETKDVRLQRTILSCKPAKYINIFSLSLVVQLTKTKFKHRNNKDECKMVYEQLKQTASVQDLKAICKAAECHYYSCLF
jgi:hypothetical protein